MTKTVNLLFARLLGCNASMAAIVSIGAAEQFVAAPLNFQERRANTLEWMVGGVTGLVFPSALQVVEEVRKFELGGVITLCHVTEDENVKEEIHLIWVTRLDILDDYMVQF